ncbi:ATP-binding cassette domain-containing protein [Pseudonocardia sp. DSM 110487]|uniref:ABC transporter ATP-binding protein n=1 Tax=Pseudonocardia sp. DSM 110487 TaxID=2865833 RepID=UPI001C6A31F7|nr:ATP-binding cassette domain-containing protein [Pseudonocardia sp. DSM 110487]QYN36319.1 ATP-binding cassette domain-containing protein [Pseudonocardia sp. DSM 110487]
MLAVEGLSVRYGDVTALHEVDIRVADGEVVALIGESGSGKSTVLDAVLGVLPSSAAVSGTIRPGGLRRGIEIGYVAQDPFGSCDPVWPVGHHVAEAWRVHGQSAPRGHIARRLAALGVAPDGLRRRPHTWSGGMLQRADLVAATAHEPPLLLADEPTSALDADTAEAAMAGLVGRARSALVAGHDLALLSRYADEVYVLLRGRVVEHIRIDRGGVAELAAKAGHEHTRALLAALPSNQLRQSPFPATSLQESGVSIARLERVTLAHPGGPPVLVDVDFHVGAGEVVGICGPSGQGKTTVLRALAGLHRPASGTVRLGGVEVWQGRRPHRPRPGYVMPIFQDVSASLDPRWPVWRSVAEAGATRPDVERLFADVGLSPAHLDARPHQLSGGQGQRVAIARALAGKPALIVADEPTAALDPTVAAGVVRLLREAADGGCAVVVASHDDARLLSYADRVLRVAELGIRDVGSSL